MPCLTAPSPAVLLYILLACFHPADPLLVQQQLLGQAASLKPLLADLFACFALDDTGAAQLLYSRAAARQAVAYAAPATRQDVPAGPSSTPGSTGGTSSTRGSSSSSRRKSPGVGVGLVNGHGTVRQADGAAAPPSSSSSSKGVPGLASASGPELPRMPLSLVHLTSSSSYTAVAGVARALGRCAAAADGAAGGWCCCDGLDHCMGPPSIEAWGAHSVWLAPGALLHLLLYLHAQTPPLPQAMRCNQPC
jgi:hypothetical protein